MYFERYFLDHRKEKVNSPLSENLLVSAVCYAPDNDYKMNFIWTIPAI